jgi:hypothetical protein
MVLYSHVLSRTVPKLFTSIQQISVVNGEDSPLPLEDMNEESTVTRDIERATTLHNPNRRNNSTHNVLKHDNSQLGTYIRIETKSIHKACSQQCPCQCHVPFKGTTPWWLQGVIGSAFINFTGTPLLNYRSCNFHGCHIDQDRTGSVRFQYLFPTWILKRGIQFTASWHALSGVGGNWTLRIPQIIDNGFIQYRLFVAMEHDTVVEVQGLLKKYCIRIFDTILEGDELTTLFEVSHVTSIDSASKVDAYV